MITPLGKFLREYRIEHDLYLKDMCLKLNMRPHQLSAIEFGAIASKGFKDNLIAQYSFTDTQLAKLNKLLEEHNKK